MVLKYFLEVFKSNKSKNAIVWEDQAFTYEWLLDKYLFWLKEFEKRSIKPGSVVIIHADFTPNSIALLLALIENKAIIVPITDSVIYKKEEILKISQAEIIIKVDNKDDFDVELLNVEQKNKYYNILRDEGNPGLVLFSSGSTGESKGSVHDLTHLLNKFKTKRHTLTVISFLLYDHIGGFNTLFYTLSNAGTIVTLKDRNPSEVLGLIEKYNVELLPTSPTFLNLIILSEEYKSYNLESLKIITYGTEPMPKITLNKLNDIFPNVKFIQTYGLSEVGILRSKSKSSNSLWVKVGGEDYKTRIVDGLLEIKAKSSMLGYLNAESPFTKDGWFKTGDYVEVDGDYIKIIGRKSEIINIGGEKVYPQEVENLILSMEGVADVLVYAEKNAIIGNVVSAKVKIKSDFSEKETIQSIKKFCYENLERYKVPVKIIAVKKEQYSGRFKKQRDVQ